MIFENTLPEEISYRIIPTSKNIITERIGQQERRTIYEGWDNWTQLEKDFVHNIMKDLAKDSIGASEVLRFCVARHWDE